MGLLPSPIENKKATVVLVHGVGDAQPGDMSRDIKLALAESNSNVDAEFREFVWNAFVDKPKADPLNLAYLTLLSSAWVNAAAHGLLPDPGAHRRAGLKWLAPLLSILVLDGTVIVIAIATPLLIIMACASRFLGVPLISVSRIVRVCA